MTKSVISESYGRRLFKFSNNSVVPHSQQVQHAFHDKQSLAQIVKHFKYVKPNITFNIILKFTSQNIPKLRMEKPTKGSVCGCDNALSKGRLQRSTPSTLRNCKLFWSLT
jgi:hypothetical protein